MRESLANVNLKLILLHRMGMTIMSDHSPKKTHFCWQELITTDKENAKGFYSALLNWQTRDLKVEGGSSYTIFSNQDKDLAGMIQLPATNHPTPPQWLSYIAVDNLDTIIASAIRLGATLLVPQQNVPDHGRFAVITDPQGATVAFWEKCQDEALC